MTDTCIKNSEEFQSDFIKILADHINKQKTSITGLDGDVLYECAQRHQVTPMVYYQCRDILSQNKKAEAMYLASQVYYMKRKIAVSEIDAALKDIPHIFMKGAVVAECYPEPSLRLMGDVDFLVPADKRDEADKLLRDAGFAFLYKEQNEVGTWSYKKHQNTFEMHVQLMHEGMAEDKMYGYFFDVWDNVKDGQLDNNFHFLFMAAHIKEHLYDNGCGFRQFMDIAAATLSWKDLDWDKIIKTAEELGLKKFLLTLLAFNERWFNVKSPYEGFAIDENFYKETTDNIFRNGVFGFDNEDNYANEAVNKIKNGENYNAISSFFRAVFLPYSNLVTMPEYSFLKGKKWLLPVAWIYRIVLKWKSRKKVKNKFFVSKETTDKRLNYLEKWGL